MMAATENLDQPRAVLSSEVLAFWKADDLCVLRSLDRARRELHRFECDVCGVPFRVVPHAIGAVEILYRCDHGPRGVQ
jgi:hypothetical protein